MAKLANFLQEMNLYIEPKTLLYIFIGLACLSLIAICSVMLSNVKANEERNKKINEESLSEDNKYLKQIKEAKISFSEENSVKEELVKTEPLPEVTKEDTPRYSSLDELIKTSTSIELPAGLREEKMASLREEQPAQEVSDTLKEAVTDPLDQNDDAKEPLYKTMPQIFSSVYLEPRKEEVQKKKSNIFIQEEIPPQKEQELSADVEDEIEEMPIEKPGIKIFPDIIDEIKAHRDEEDHDMALPFEKKIPEEVKKRSVLPIEEEKVVIPDDASGEVVLTPEMLKERLSMLTKLMSENNQAPAKKSELTKGEDELDNLLKQIGLDKSPNDLEDEEKIILGK